MGQVVLLSGEAGIGKSRLVQVLTEQVASEPQAWLTPCQCSPYHQNTALCPWIDLLERVALRFDREESPDQKLQKLEGFVVQYGLPLAQAVPLFAALLSLPPAADYTPLSMSPEQQKQKTLHALLTLLLLNALAEALALVDKTGERWWEAELHRLKGELLRRRASPTEEVEACFHQALDIARRQQAKSLELRAAMSLSRLWQQQGQRADARELLAPIHGWFTEGFDTADLQEAKALLEELS